MNPAQSQSPRLLRRIARGCYRCFWYALVTIIILAAVVLSLVRLYLPDVEAYREQIEQVASQFLEHEVRIASMDARLAGMTPVIVFKDVRMMGRNGRRELVRFESARLSVDVLASLRARRIIPRGFTVKGADLAITRRENGTLLIQGIDIDRWEKSLSAANVPPSQGSNELANWLFRRSRLGLEDSDIVWQDFAREGKVMQFRNVNLKLRNQGRRHQLTGALTIPEEMGRDVEIAMDLYGNMLNPRQWKGRFYAQGFEIDVANWGIKPAFQDITLHEGKADFRVWGEWDQGQPREISGEFETYDVAVSSSVRARPLQLDRAGGQFLWRGTREQWRLNINDFNFAGEAGSWPSTRISVEQTDHGEFSQWHLYSDYIRIEDANTLLAESGLLQTQLHTALKTLDLQGELRRAHVVYRSPVQDQPRLIVDTEFYNLRNKPWRRVPGMRGLSGSVRGSERAGLLSLESSDGAVAFTKLFRQPLGFTQLEGRLRWRHDGQRIQVDTDALRLDTDAIRTESALSFVFPLDGQTSPFIDLQTRFTDGRAEYAGRYYPVGVMRDELVRWLDEALSAGRVSSGVAVLRGRLADFPFREHQGQFVVDFEASGVRLKYKDGWPRLEDISASARFTGLGMHIAARQGRIYRTRLTDTEVNIEHFQDPVLRVDGRFAGPTDDLARYLANSPIGAAYRDHYQQARVGGRSTGALQLSIPLSDRMERLSPLRYSGQINFADSEAHLMNDALEIEGLNGEISFDNGHFRSRDLQAQIMGGPAQLRLFMNPLDAEHQVVQLAADGEMDTGRLAEIFAIPALARISGRSQWQGIISQGVQTPQRDMPGFVQFRSDLQGTRLDLPPPLEKAAESEMPVFIKLTFSRFNRPTLYSQLGEVLTARLQLNTDDPDRTALVKGAVAFGEPEVELPRDNEMRFSGSLQALSLGRWQRLIDKTDEVQSSKPGLAETNLPIVFDFDELHLVTGEQAKRPDLDTPQDSSLLNGEVKSLYLNDMALGHFTIASSRMRDGIEYGTIRLETGTATIEGSGTWTYRAGKNQTNLVMQMSSADMGQTLRNMGIKAVIDGGKGDIVLHALWPGPPSGFGFDQLDGSLGVSIEKGSLVQVDPGAGRVFGLLSLTELPRRLTLDFSELEEGFKFDLIRGNFDIDDGRAHTDNLFVDSPIALIRIQGDTDLVARQFDQEVTVIPRVSGTLPVVSGLAWGSQVGALVFLFERLMGSEVDKSVARRYRVTGSWEDPRITRVKQGENAQGGGG